MNDLDLRTALHRDADLVGEPAPDLLEQLVHRRQQQRRQRAGVAVAVLGVVVIAAGIPLGGALLDRSESQATDPTPTVSTVAPTPSAQVPIPAPPPPLPSVTPPAPAPEPPAAPPVPPAPSTGAPAGPTDFVLGPDGLGPLRLGMSRDQAEATGLVPPFWNENPSGPCAWRSQLVGSPADAGIVLDSETLGIATIDAYAGVRTPEGIGLGSSRAEVESAYPNVYVNEHYQRGSALVPGNDAAMYRIAFRDSVVVELTLQFLDQDCYE